MNLKHYPLLAAVIMALSLIAIGTQGGCCWEETTAQLDRTKDAAFAEEAAINDEKEIDAQCDVSLGGETWAIAGFPGASESDLARVHAIGRGGSHHAMQVSNIILLTEQVAVVCTDYEPPLVYVTFLLD